MPLTAPPARCWLTILVLLLPLNAVVRVILLCPNSHKDPFRVHDSGDPEDLIAPGLYCEVFLTGKSGQAHVITMRLAATENFALENQLLRFLPLAHR